MLCDSRTSDWHQRVDSPAQHCRKIHARVLFIVRHDQKLVARPYLTEKARSQLAVIGSNKKLITVF